MSKRYARSRSPSSPGPAASRLAHLHIQAHEASLVRNQDNIASTVEYSTGTCPTSAPTDENGKGKAKTRMIRWVAQDDLGWLEDDETQFNLGGKAKEDNQEGEGYWVDR